MIHIVTTQPSSEPVTLAEIRTYLGISQVADTARDAILTSRIIAARQWCENETRRAFVTQTLTAYGRQFCAEIPLKKPLASVASVVYVDSQGVNQALAAETYQVDTVGHSLWLAYGKSWPVVRNQPNAVQIQYISGQAVVDVPPGIKEAIKFIVAQWEVFQSSIEGVVRPFTVPYAATQLLDPYRDTRQAFD